MFDVFRDSYVLCVYVMNILCTFHISVSWYGAMCNYRNTRLQRCTTLWTNKEENLRFFSAKKSLEMWVFHVIQMKQKDKHSLYTNTYTQKAIYIYIYIYRHTHAHYYKQTYIHTHIHIHTPTYIRTYPRTDTHIHTEISGSHFKYNQIQQRQFSKYFSIHYTGKARLLILIDFFKSKICKHPIKK